jgi:Cu+-exporting ATPase
MKKIYKIEGMHCNSCATAIELELEDKPGIKKAKADFTGEKAEVEFDENKISEKEIKTIIKKLGYNAK